MLYMLSVLQQSHASRGFKCCLVLRGRWKRKGGGLTCVRQSRREPRELYCLAVFKVFSSGALVLLQDALDLIEFVSGPADSEWGGLRNNMGHSKPWDLNYFAVGNEVSPA